MLPPPTSPAFVVWPIGPATASSCSATWRMRPGGGRGTGITAAVRRRLRHRQDDERRGHRRRPRARPLRRQPGDGRRQVHRRDREEPRSHLRRGRQRQRGPAVRRGRCAVRAAVRGPRQPRSLRQHRGRLPVAADGDVRRARRAVDQPALQHRRRLHPSHRRIVDFASARRDAPPTAVGAQHRVVAAARRPRPRLRGRRVRALRRQHPLDRRDAGVPRPHRASGPSTWATSCGPSPRSTASSGG